MNKISILLMSVHTHFDSFVSCLGFIHAENDIAAVLQGVDPCLAIFIKIKLTGTGKLI